MEFDPFSQLNTIYSTTLEYPPPPPDRSPPIPCRRRNPTRWSWCPRRTPRARPHIDNIWFHQGGRQTIGDFSMNTVTGATSSYQDGPDQDELDAHGIAWDPLEDEFWMTEPASTRSLTSVRATAGSAKAPITIPDPVGVWSIRRPDTSGSQGRHERQDRRVEPDQ